MFSPVINDALVAFFDGPVKDELCGVGMVVTMDLNHAFLLHMDASCGTNTRSELLAMWGILYFINKR